MLSSDLRISYGLADEKIFSRMMVEPFGDDFIYMSKLFEWGYIDKKNIVALFGENDLLPLSAFCVFPVHVKSLRRGFVDASVMSYVVTRKEFRGNGLSSFLISSFLKSSNNPVFLFPSELSLFDFYSALEFYPCSFSEYKVFESQNRYFRDKVKKIEFSSEVYDKYLLSKADNEVYKDEKLFKAAIKEKEYFGGGLFSDGDSYAFFSQENGKRIVSEPFGYDLLSVAKSLSREGRTYLTLPANPGSGRTLAMVYSANRGEYSDVFIDNFLNFNQYF